MKKTDSKTSEAKASEVKWTTELAPEPPAGAAEHLGQGSTVEVLPAAGDSSSPGGTHDGQTAGAASRSGGASRTGKHRGGAPCCRRLVIPRRNARRSNRRSRQPERRSISDREAPWWCSLLPAIATSLVAPPDPVGRLSSDMASNGSITCHARVKAGVGTHDICMATR
ncbi:hypothetical protein BHM03_00026167 [Ensete ventricosum]|nr:hypothetical protein BHM03_00026167 [Ensete ventricosum]